MTFAARSACRAISHSQIRTAYGGQPVASNSSNASNNIKQTLTFNPDGTIGVATFDLQAGAPRTGEVFALGGLFGPAVSRNFTGASGGPALPAADWWVNAARSAGAFPIEGVLDTWQPLSQALSWSIYKTDTVGNTTQDISFSFAFSQGGTPVFTFIASLQLRFVS